MDFKLGFLSKKKDKHDTKQTNEVKQATISDTQASSIGLGGNVQDNTLNQQTPTMQDNSQNFINPFGNNGDTQNFNNLETNTNGLNQNMGASEQQLPSQNFNQTENSGLEVQGQEQSQVQPNQFGDQFNPGGNQVQHETNLSQLEINTHDQMQQFDAQREQKTQAEAAAVNQPGQSNTNAQAQANPQVSASSSSLSKDQIVEMIDETVEKIIDEKWNELVGSVNKIGKWKDKTESVIEMLKEDIVAMRDGFGKLETKIVNKISNYDRDIMDVSGEIKALEKVFQKITPTLINNVNELSKIANDFKGIEVKKKKTDAQTENPNENKVQ